MTFLNETGREQMNQFDHIKRYLPSTRVHWSYPALADDIVWWQRRVSRLPNPVLATALAQEGFTAVLIDRNGYADQGRLILSELGASSSGAVLAEDRRYVAVDLRRLPRADVPAGQLPRVGDTVTAATDGLPPCATSTPHTLEWIGEAATPFGPSPIPVRSAGEFVVTGWAVDGNSRSLAGEVDIVIGDTAFPSFYGIERADVAKYFGEPAYQLSGFTARFAGSDIGSDARLLSVRILASDRSCYYQGQSARLEAR